MSNTTFKNLPSLLLYTFCFIAFVVTRLCFPWKQYNITCYSRDKLLGLKKKKRKKEKKENKTKKNNKKTPTKNNNPHSCFQKSQLKNRFNPWEKQHTLKHSFCTRKFLCYDDCLVSTAGTGSSHWQALKSITEVQDRLLVHPYALSHPKKGNFTHKEEKNTRSKHTKEGKQGSIGI